MKIAFALLITGCLMYSCSSVNRYFNLEDEWVGEELLEQAIDSYTGLDLDLTPSSKEK